MTIQCPECSTRYRIDVSRVSKTVAKVKCPQCAAVFEVQLRVASAAEQPLPPAAVGSAAASAPVVLIVDDSGFFRDLVVDVLKPLQLQFLMAADGVEALQLIRRQRPDLVILDLNLPGMSGSELIREVRRDPALKQLRLLAMSGVYRKEADAVQIQAAGADDFISKTFKPEQLQSRVKTLLAARS